MRRFIRASAKILAGLMIVVMLAYLGACVYGNFIAKPKGTISLPSADKVPYVLAVKNTGTAILASKVVQIGPSTAGQRVYQLPEGYWELVKGGKFKYTKFNLTLDEKTWGEIDVSRRTNGQN